MTLARITLGTITAGIMMSHFSHAEAVEISDELNARIVQARPGEVIDMGDFPMADLPLFSYEKKPAGHQFLFSDDPEYFRVPEGAAMREIIEPGMVQLYVYHVNGTTETRKKITSVIENLGTAPLNLRFERYAFAGPSKNYYDIGKSGMRQFFGGTVPSQPIRIAPGDGAPIDPAMDRSVVEFDELVHGFYDFEIDQPARVTTLQTDPDVPSLDAARRIREVLPPRVAMGAGRGLYPFSNYEVTARGDNVMDSSRGATQLVVADGKIDPWIEGFDSSTSSTVLLKGNYGVVYRIRIPRRSSDGRGMALLTWNYQSGAKWCDAMAAAIKVSEGVFPGGIVEVPSPETAFGGRIKAALIQIFPPLEKGNSNMIEMVYTPPGASCLPTPLLFVPVRMNSTGPEE